MFILFTIFAIVLVLFPIFNRINMRFFILSALFLLSIASVYGQSEIIVEQLESLQKPWTSLDVNDDNFQFVVVTDRTGGMRPGIFETGVAKINLIQPEFVVSVGDLIQGYTRDTVELERQWKEFNGFVDQFQMPFFYVAGNHDYTNEVMAKMWKEKYGADRYHFVYKNVLFLCLNSEDGATALKDPDIGDEQLTYAKSILAKYPDVRWTMVFMHQPLWIRPNAKNWLALEAELENRKHSVFTGHVHRFTLYERNRSDYFTLATMGGGSRLRGKQYGEFDHFMWVTMTDSGPYYANIMLDGIHDKSVYTEEMLAKREQMEAHPPVRLLPVFQDKKAVDKVVFLAENPEAEPMTVSISLEDGDYLSAGQKSVEREIPANGKMEIEVPVKMTGRVSAQAQPLSATVELRSEKFGWNTRYNAFPTQRYTLKAARRAIKVDGDLSEWGKKWPYQFGEEGSKVQFSVQESGENLYVAVEVQDADIQTGFGKGLFDQDGVIISIDPRPIEQSAYNTREQEGVMRGEWVALIGQPNAAEFDPAFTEFLPKGAEGKGKKTATGYRVEFAVPIAALEKIRGGKLTDLRLNVNVIDADAGQKSREYSWLPDWSDMYVGSGTFFRR